MVNKGDGALRALFFDAADTLFFVRGGVGRVYFDVARKYSPDLDPGDIGRAFSRTFGSAPPLAFDARGAEERRALERRYWYELVKGVFEEAGMFEGFDRYFEELFETFRARVWELFPETRGVLEELKRRDYALSIISNFDSRIYDVLEEFEIGHFFDGFFISSEVGYAKPSREIFHRAVAELGVSARECLHVGDSLEHDYLGASAAGMRSVLVDRDCRYRSRRGLERVDDLGGIISYVDEIAGG